jgi:hypothetical protein
MKNFGDRALSDGVEMFELMSNTETELLRNRTKMFKELKDITLDSIEDVNAYAIGLQTELSEKRAKLLKENANVLSRAFNQAEILIDNELENAYRVGINKAEKEAEEVIQILNTTDQKEQIISSTKEASRQSQLTALRTQDREFGQLTAMILGAVMIGKLAGSKKTLKQVIDENTRKYNAKGVVGKQGLRAEYSLSLYNEMNIREQSQAILLAGGGAVVSEDDRVYVSQHQSASDACRPHQGKFYIDDVYRQGRRGRWTNLPLLSTVVDRKGRPGLFHFNCRHTITLAPKSFKVPEAPGDAIVNKRGKVNDLKAKQTYAIEQKQRVYQRNVRQYKQVEANALTEQERARARQLVKNNQARLRGLEKVAEQNGIPFYRQPHKENIEFKFETFKPEF